MSNVPVNRASQSTQSAMAFERHLQDLHEQHTRAAWASAQDAEGLAEAARDPANASLFRGLFYALLCMLVIVLNIGLPVGVALATGSGWAGIAAGIVEAAGWIAIGKRLARK